MTRFLLVELEGGLDRSRRVGIECALKQIPGVRMVCDLEAISAETLGVILLAPEPSAPVVVHEHVWQGELAV